MNIGMRFEMGLAQQRPISSEWSSVLTRSEAFLDESARNQRGIALISAFVRRGADLGFEEQEPFRSVLDALLFLVVPEQREAMARFYAGKGRQLRFIASPAVIAACDIAVLRAIALLNTAWDCGWRARDAVRIGALLDVTDPSRPPATTDPPDGGAGD